MSTPAPRTKRAPVPFSNEPAPAQTVDVLNSFDKLAKTAAHLNQATDKLTQVIAKLDSALAKLNLGVSVWAEIDSWSDENADHDTVEIGYFKPKDRWGVCIRRSIGNYHHPERDNVTSWMFNDAPRDLRIRSIRLVPKLLDTLNDEAMEVTSKLIARTDEAERLAIAIAMATPGGAQ